MMDVYFFNLRITFEIAKGTRSCRGYQSGCLGIKRGDEHLAVYEPNRSIQYARNNYCNVCASSKIKKIEEELNQAVESFKKIKILMGII